MVVPPLGEGPVDLLVHERLPWHDFPIDQHPLHAHRADGHLEHDPPAFGEGTRALEQANLGPWRQEPLERAFPGVPLVGSLGADREVGCPGEDLGGAGQLTVNSSTIP